MVVIYGNTVQHSSKEVWIGQPSQQLIIASMAEVLLKAVEEVNIANFAAAYNAANSVTYCVLGTHRLGNSEH